MKRFDPSKSKTPSDEETRSQALDMEARARATQAEKSARQSAARKRAKESPTVGRRARPAGSVGTQTARRGMRRLRTGTTGPQTQIRPGYRASTATRRRAMSASKVDSKTKPPAFKKTSRRMPGGMHRLSEGGVVTGSGSGPQKSEAGGNLAKGFGGK